VEKRIMKKILILLFMGLCMVAVSYASEKKEQPTEYSELHATIKTVSKIEPEEYEVYAAVLAAEKLFGPLFHHGVVLEQWTVKKKITKNRWEAIDNFMIDDFNRKNGKKYLLENKFPSPSELGEFRIIVRTEKDKNELHSIFYRGRTYVSRVGFNKEKTKALVYVEHIPSPKKGFGYIVLLDKAGVKWMITEKASECCEEDWIP
jgi:hypothetical protein